MLIRAGRPAAEISQQRASQAPRPPTSAREGDLPTFDVRLGPPSAGSQGLGAVAGAAADPEFGIPDDAVADVAGGSAGPSDADPP